MKRFRVKVCGITRPADAALAVQLGADLIGVIFHPGSPRVVTVNAAGRILTELPPVVQRVAVFVNETNDKILRLADRLRLDFVQLHGNQSARDIRTIRAEGFGVIKAVHGASAKVPNIGADLIMLDNMTSDRQGGTGRTFAWPIRPRRTIANLMLAGGINEQNVAEGVRLFNPLVVDVNSGVESAPGIKSRRKLTRFMQACDRIRHGS